MDTRLDRRPADPIGLDEAAVVVYHRLAALPRDSVLAVWEAGVVTQEDAEFGGYALDGGARQLPLATFAFGTARIHRMIRRALHEAAKARTEEAGIGSARL